MAERASRSAQGTGWRNAGLVAVSGGLNAGLIGLARPVGPPLSCDAPQLLFAEARRYCDVRGARLAQDVRNIAGSGNPDRDATFARQGARRLAAWENQRAAPTETDEPCVQLGPIAECGGVNISIELFSTRDGVLPNLRKRRE